MGLEARVQASRHVPVGSLITAVVQTTTTRAGPTVSLLPHTAFAIVVRVQRDGCTTLRDGDATQWILDRRYSAFVELHRSLARKFGDLPSLPPKRILGNMDDVFVEERRQQLDRYLLLLCGRPAIVFTEDLQRFLDLPEHGVEIAHPSTIVATTILADPRFGVNDAAYDDGGVVVTASSDTRVFSRVDSFVTNTSFPWEQQGAIVPVGSVNVWTRNASFEWAVTACHYFPDAARCVAYSNDHRQICVGLASGVIHMCCLPASADELTGHTTSPVHQGRVTCILFPSVSQNLIISGGEDHFIALTDIPRLLTVSKHDCGSPVLSLDYHAETRRLFVGCAQVIHVLDATDGHFRLLSHLSDGHGPIAALSYCHSELVLFSGAKRICTVRAAQATDRSLSSLRVVAQLKNGPTSSITAVAFSATYREVITGHKNGLLCVWDSKGTGPIEYVLEAHKSRVSVILCIGDDTVMTAGRDGNIKLWKRPASQRGRRADPVPVRRMIMQFDQGLPEDASLPGSSSPLPQRGVG
ncbi:PX domain-containing protein [Plasmodiophora brassicae]